MKLPTPSILSAAAALAVTACLSATASAGGLYKEQVYADSFGNLVIHNPSGYKRIIVGQGHVADAYNLTGSYYEPEVVYLDEEKFNRDARRCYRPPYRWQGRGYMYGLPDHVVPQAPLVCE
jgi:hypothetical protein